MYIIIAGDYIWHNCRFEMAMKDEAIILVQEN